MAIGKGNACGDNAKILHSFKSLLAEFVPTLRESAFVFFDIFFGCVQGPVSCSERQVEKKRFVSWDLLEESEGVAGDGSREIIFGVVAEFLFNVLAVSTEAKWGEETGGSTQDAVEVIKAAVIRINCFSILSRKVPFPGHKGGVSSGAKSFRKGRATRMQVTVFKRCAVVDPGKKGCT